MQEGKIRNLVLGSSGFIGVPFCRFLEAQGEEVVPFDIRRSPDEDARFATLPLDKVDRVYFLAWDVGGAKYLFREDALIHQLEWNMKLLENVMKQLQSNSVPFFYVSSQFAEEYGTPYGATKRLGEIWVRLVPHGYWGRQWNVYGELEDSNDRSHVIGDFINQAFTTGTIVMMTTGEEMRQFIHVEDSARAYHKILTEKIKGGIYDISSGRWTSIREVAEMIAGMTGAKVIPGEKIGFSHRNLPSHDRIPGWEPQISLEEGLKRMVEEFRRRHPDKKRA
ncbi:NAD(P)-dependent oxidoreductase [Patescibacteria group bacterium]|nr:NAD(P)-dependent oxidoreductase [Patescibacteria group bacterium]MDE1946809.1 NAD(P)-dependent oxidoreductase [Patescibacteria group bacterium]MDE2011147.1 NAD(P)-dependent oxidoreductase [Patescibacteria group bacterium]MDE2233056.1 NAD(P)-dependent oxidoreductase [Patescibacteria group bacterium]